MKRAYPDGVDALIDLVSDAAAFDHLSGVVKPGGVALTTIFTADPEKLKAKNLKGGNFEVKGSVSVLESVNEMIEVAENISIPIQQISLEEAPEALARSKAGRALGKTVIVI